MPHDSPGTYAVDMAFYENSNALCSGLEVDLFWQGGSENHRTPQDTTGCTTGHQK